MRYFLHLFVFSLLLPAHQPVLIFKKNVPEEDWQLRKVEKGITVYTRNTESSKYKELKAVYQMKTSLSSVIALLNDVDSYPKWIYRCGSSKVLKQASDQDLIRYQTVVAPWPVDNRDMIVQVHSWQDEKTGIVYQAVSALPDYAKEIPGHVRIREFRAKWTLTPMEKGIVEVKYELLVNPAGSIPAWVVNMAVVDGPFETSVNMKEWLMKEKYQQSSFAFIKEP
jgi:ribosome-associated toxin RatA of RatAB toxin-antitoxin module